ncbi:D-amino acid dehydrogenase [Neomegalonema sp.]|uniref:D-amino acid dehydrogenase n=1 Tax=Neomegalonema sp. TaxID=2039713 RepID=UPI002630C638|nr:D-amino acid dehydrogenase [Neomegalonema sp.]MDD2869260.1 D-amino acid dehydrogenase [Neomegalonema sp.]
MKIVILGAGVIGVASAWHLVKAGHEVVVLERQEGPALETSFANAGEISPGYSSPWAAPGVPLKALKWLFMKHAPLIIRPSAVPGAAAWMLAMLRECTAGRYAVNKERMVRLAEYSRDQLVALREETGISYDHRTQGTLQVFRTQKQFDGIGKDVEVLKAGGVPFEILDRAGCVAAEPGLAFSQDQIVGGLRLPHDETGDCFLFTNALSRLCEEKGVVFRYGVKIEGLKQAGDRVSAVTTDQGEVSGDVFVAALGSYTPALLKPLGLKAPIYPLKGYSITIPIKEEARAPVSTVLDETYKVAVTRLGSRIRVGGMAEIAGFSHDLPAARRATLELTVESLFGGAGDQTQARFWTGLRPMTPDSTPILGPTRLPNLYLNSGHGTLGWTMACGSGRALADLISGRKPEIETADLALSRYA